MLYGNLKMDEIRINEVIPEATRFYNFDYKMYHDIANNETSICYEKNSFTSYNVNFFMFPLSIFYMKEIDLLSYFYRISDIIYDNMKKNEEFSGNPFYNLDRCMRGIENIRDKIGYYDDNVFFNKLYKGEPHTLISYSNLDTVVFIFDTNKNWLKHKLKVD